MDNVGNHEWTCMCETCTDVQIMLDGEEAAYEEYMAAQELLPPPPPLVEPTTNLFPPMRGAKYTPKEWECMTKEVEWKIIHLSYESQGRRYATSDWLSTLHPKKGWKASCPEEANFYKALRGYEDMCEDL